MRDFNGKQRKRGESESVSVRAQKKTQLIIRLLNSKKNPQQLKSKQAFKNKYIKN